MSRFLSYTYHIISYGVNAILLLMFYSSISCCLNAYVTLHCKVYNIRLLYRATLRREWPPYRPLPDVDSVLASLDIVRYALGCSIFLEMPMEKAVFAKQLPKFW